MPQVGYKNRKEKKKKRKGRRDTPLFSEQQSRRPTWRYGCLLRPVTRLKASRTVLVLLISPCLEKNISKPFTFSICIYPRIISRIK
jgi:hypothetical protein